MDTVAEPDLLYPLTHFHENGGAPLPEFEVVASPAVPEPYRSLLVHDGDMTSRLEAFHKGEIVLTVLHREKTETAYRREVVLRIEETGLPVEYGAIEIDLEAFAPEVRAKILEEHLPLGGLLNSYAIGYRSRPKAFIRLGADELMGRLFAAEECAAFYGRCNELLDAGGRVFARIVEVLRP